MSGYSHFRDGDCILFDDGELERQAALWNVQFARCLPGSEQSCPQLYAISGRRRCNARVAWGHHTLTSVTNDAPDRCAPALSG